MKSKEVEMVICDGDERGVGGKVRHSRHQPARLQGRRDRGFGQDHHRSGVLAGYETAVQWDSRDRSAG